MCQDPPIREYPHNIRQAQGDLRADHRQSVDRFVTRSSGEDKKDKKEDKHDKATGRTQLDPGFNAAQL